jgi:hypothetical protein
VNAPHALAPRPPRLAGLDEEAGLTALLDLFSAEEPPPGTRAAGRPRPTVRSAGAGLRGAGARLLAMGAGLLAWARSSSHRAAAWGSGPEGVWRAW